MNTMPAQTGRGTAITTAVLSLALAGLSAVLTVIFLFTRFLLEAFDPSSEERLSVWAPTGVAGVVAAIFAVAFTVGAVQLLRHKPSGRVIVIACSVVFAGGWIYGVATDNPGPSLSSIVLVGLPVLTLVFALLPGTKQWCAR
ncbi:hypothetical protein [Mycolicibacterium setense]|uniref:hypothetical protein n=1 Tax=Mycolicibacterium setense TaxID=431269 RepID=UPI0005756061|nr:hypothetical protein [Mycolicibacterium setense]KHO17579.1 hypothetical protein QQ25_25590 [Mycolicibacterium setense]MCV7111497.1 hypothetical protein [Mycolicibacterium setense]